MKVSVVHWWKLWAAQIQIQAQPLIITGALIPHLWDEGEK